MALEKLCTWLWKGNLKREMESILIATQNNNIKVEIDNTRQNSKYRSCGDETVNYIISECSKLVQKEYKTRRDWVGKVIHWELCKKFTFEHANKWYMHKPESVQENETYKLLFDFGIQTDHIITARRWDIMLIIKKKKKKRKKKQQKKAKKTPHLRLNFVFTTKRN